MKRFSFTGLLDILSSTVHLQVFKTEGRTHQLTNYKPIARYIPRFSIPGLLNMSSSSPACRSEQIAITGSSPLPETLKLSGLIYFFNF